RNEAALFSLVILSEALQEFGDVVLFGSAYLFVAPEDPDRGQIMARVQAAEKKMVQSGRLQVKAQPADAEITLDGVPVGRGALALNLPAGRSFALRASAPDFVPWEEQVRLEAGEERTLAHRLDKIIYKGTLTARVIPDGAVDVYVDTRKVGTDTMKLTLTEGRRLVCFKKEGWDRWWRYVDVPRNGSTDLDVQLEQTTEMDGPCDVWPTED
ncbi:MAG: PEGA domain-containing protein, partial [Deltaproteobacteria bacterium]|nr:PEGA domain-containing protein [Deltaproteobacteria bacterium]